MRPASVYWLCQSIGFENIIGASVLDVGCGQGYLVTHFLNLGASRVTGTDYQQVVSSVPMIALDAHTANGKTFAIIVDDFAETKLSFQGFDIILMMIGQINLVEKLLDIFVTTAVKCIAFMAPSSGRREYEKKITKLSIELGWQRSDSTINLCVSGEQRKVITLRKSPKLEKKVYCWNQTIFVDYHTLLYILLYSARMGCLMGEWAAVPNDTGVLNYKNKKLKIVHWRNGNNQLA
jgi:SAM-dependent methyltransferase